MLRVRDIAKTFVMHLRGGLRLPVFSNVSFEVAAGECLVLGGPSGVGKSSILKMLYGNYGVDAGEILVAHDGRSVDLAKALPREVLDVRRLTLGYVSQFLRAIPRVPALEVVADPLIARGSDRVEALERAEAALARLNLPCELWQSSARHLLRRRAAARQHRPWLHHRSSASCCSTSRQPRSMPPTAPSSSR